MADQEKENEATPTKEPYSSKYAVFCGKVYDFFAALKNGQREHTPETLLRSRKRGTWIVTAFIVFAVIGMFTDDEEEVQVAPEREETPASESRIANEVDNKPVEVSRPSSASTYRPSSYVYVCADCATVVTGVNQPKGALCPSSKSRYHHWENAGRQGNHTYQCGKCGACIQADLPKPTRCPRGQGHQWQRL